MRPSSSRRRAPSAALACAALLAACGDAPARPPAAPTPPAPALAPIAAGKDAVLPDDVLTFVQDLAWSPDSTRIAFSLRQISRAKWQANPRTALANTQYDVYVVDAGGGGLRQLTDTAEDEVWLSWHPDGHKLSFASVRDADEAIYTLTLDGAEAGEVARLTPPAPGTADAAWSPDGKRIVYAAKADAHVQLFEASPIGTDVRQLTHEGFDCRAPVWSPDGRQLVFQGNPRGAGKDDIFLLDTADGDAVSVLTHDDTDDIYPAWLPDGRITFTMIDVEGVRRVVMRMPLSDKRETLARGPFFARVSPDGHWIAYISGVFPDTAIDVRPFDPAAEPKRIVE